MRFINRIYIAEIGERWDNAHLLEAYEPHLERLVLDDVDRAKLRDYVRFQLIGERCRNLIAGWAGLRGFASRAAAYESTAEQALDALAAAVAPVAAAAGITFDGIVSTTTTGNLMPGLSYRMACRLAGLVRTDSLMLDLGNVGCTGAIQALNFVRQLDEALRHVLVVAVEVPSTAVRMDSTSLAVWQANCTFGDGAAAVWVSTLPDVGDPALAIEEMRSWQRSDTGLDLIKWEYDENYYRFGLRDEKTFDRDVRQYVVDALQETHAAWKDEPRWAIHPAGVLLLVRISRKLGIPTEAIRASVDHYRAHSNMSSVSILQIMLEVGAHTPAGHCLNLLTMGAGFNVLYGRVRRIG
jgi:alkylresorcinol/alkylpyrone synthase